MQFLKHAKNLMRATQIHQRKIQYRKTLVESTKVLTRKKQNGKINKMVNE